MVSHSVTFILRQLPFVNVYY